MRIAVLGTGTVGTTLASGFERAGHEVLLGTRDPASGAGAEWAAQHRGGAATSADAAAASDVVVLALPGTAVLDVVSGLGAAADGKVVVDVTNPLDFSHGFPPRLFTTAESLAEQVQAALPAARVVKTLNTVNASVMVDPARIAGEHTMPLCGDDDGAKADVRRLLRDLGWSDGALLDLGPLAAARATEAYVLFWVALMQATGTDDVSVRVVTA
ncbi:MAG: NADPH-dependent F420 reductase [Actinomycetes bacterium]